MEVRLASQVTIAASLAETFKYLTTLKYHFLWNPHLQSIAPLNKLQRGMKYKTTSLLLGIKVSGTNLVTKLVPNQELELKNSTGALTYRVTYRLRLDHKKTIVSCSTIVSIKSEAFIFTRPVLRLLAQRELRTDLQALKIAVEQQLG